jgi:hypothetical protein
MARGWFAGGTFHSVKEGIQALQFHRRKLGREYITNIDMRTSPTGMRIPRAGRDQPPAPRPILAFASEISTA